MKIFRLLFVAVFVAACNLVVAQNSTIKGVVSDDLNNFVEGAKIFLENTTYEATSGQNGAFEIPNVPFGDYKLVVSSENHNIHSINVKATTPVTDVGFVNMVSSGSVAEEMQDNIATVSLSDSELKDSPSTTVSGVLTASRDAFANAVAYTFSTARFRYRGYDYENFVTYLNGVPMTDLASGNSMFFLWTGLNDVFRNRENSYGLGATDFSFGSTGSASYIDSRASRQRKQVSVSYATSNRVYENRVMATVGTGLMKGGWAVSGSFSRRWSDEGYIPGTYYDGMSLFLAVDKIINSAHSLSLVTFGSPTERGKSAPAMQELYDIADDNYYNPTWGYQNGKKRNASVNITKIPVILLEHDWKINEKTYLRTSLGGSWGENVNTAIDWYNAPDPRPDFYRRLPSYYDEFPEIAAQIDYILRNYENERQLDWNQMYEYNDNSLETIEDANGISGNSVSGKRSAYIVEERVADGRKFHFNTVLNTDVTDYIHVTGGLTFMKQVTDNFKRVGDLLGGDFYVDVNQYAEQDFAGNNDAIQNDLNNPNRIVYEGDKFGYNYTSDIAKTSGWAQGQVKLEHIEFFAALELSQTNFKRTGNVRNGLFPDNSYGDSKTESFFNYAVKGGATYKINGRNYLFANLASLTRAPLFENSYVSVRTRDQVAPGLKNEKVFSIEGGYLLRAPKFKARAVFYYTKFNDQVYNVSFYHSDFRDFVNYTITNIDKKHTGAELALEYPLGKGLSVLGVASIGQYTYTDRPFATVSADNTSELLAQKETVYAKNFYVGQTPQSAYTAGLNYRAKRFWFINVNFNYYDNTYIDFNPARRTTAAVDLVPENSAQYEDITEQEKVDGAFTIDLFGGKSWRLNNYFPNMKRSTFLVLNLGVSNVLNNKDHITGGYEQLRYDFENKDPHAFDTKYFYSFGATYFLNLTLRMN